MSHECNFLEFEKSVDLEEYGAVIKIKQCPYCNKELPKTGYKFKYRTLTNFKGALEKIELTEAEAEEYSKLPIIKEGPFTESNELEVYEVHP